MIKSREILIKQLEEINTYMNLSGSKDKLIDNTWIDVWSKEFKIPQNLKLAFIEYALEFLLEPYGCINFNSAFWGNEDLTVDIINKFKYFYQPIAEYLYPNSDINIVVEPSFEDTSTICILKNNVCIYYSYEKVWHLWSEPNELFSFLKDIAEDIANITQKV